MATISTHIDIRAILQTQFPTAKSFGIQLLVVDDDQIPIDTRYQLVTQDSYTELLTSGTVPYDYSQVFWSQKLRAEELMLGRWVSVDSPTYFVCGPAWEQDYTVWAPITSGAFDVTDGTNTDSISSLNFTGVTAIEQVLPILNAALAALVTPNITGLDSAVFKIDSLNRLILEMPTTGSTATTVTIVNNPADMSENILDAANGFAVSGVDAESLVDAVEAIRALNNTFYNIHERGGSAAQQLELAQYVQTQVNQLDLVVTDLDAKNPALDTDVGKQILDLNLDQTQCIYYERIGYPDSASCGDTLPAKEGSRAFSWNALTGVLDSGLNAPLTATERATLEAKGYSWVEQHQGASTILYTGKNIGKIEKHLILARDWVLARITEGIYAYMVQQPVVIFDNDHLTAIQNIFIEWFNEGISRQAFTSYTFNWPDADDFSPAYKATNKLDIADAFILVLGSQILDIKIVGTITR